MLVSSPFRVVVVGGGFAGTATAIHLLREWRGGPLELTLLERSGDFGPGVAYATPDRNHLLNVVAGGMTALPDEPEHFLRWLRAHDPAAHAGTFAPRLEYGAYVRALLADAERAAGPEARLVRIADEAVRVEDPGSEPAGAAAAGNGRPAGEASGNGRPAGDAAGDARCAVVSTRGGRRLEADAVVLAVGVNRPRVPSGTDPALLVHRGWIGDPWDHERIAALADAERVLIVGSGLTMVDVAVTLAGGVSGAAGTTGADGAMRGANGATGGTGGVAGGPELIALSRRGVLPRGHRVTPPPHLAPYRPPTGPLTADRIAAHVESAALAEVAAGGDWRSVVDGVRPFTQGLWQALPLGEQARFLARHARRWEVHRHRMAPDVAATIAALRASGRLGLRAGTLQRLEPTGDGRVAVTYRIGAPPAGAAAGNAVARSGGATARDAAERIEVDAVVNCTGPDPAPGADGDPLLSALIADRLGRAGPLGLGLETGPDGELCDCDGRPSSRLFTLGALRRGQLWETTAVPEIRCQAADLGRLLAARGAAQLARTASAATAA